MSENEENSNIQDDQLEAPREMTRRDAVQLLAALPFAAALSFPTADQERARRFVDEAMRAAAEGTAYAPKFFTPAEFRTARILADAIIPRDERSGSASDAGVMEFMDFTMMDRPNQQEWMRSGLAWLDSQACSRFSRPFADLSAAQRDAILDDIAWPARAPASMSDGVQFFNRFRDLTATGFWSSRVGVKDLQYMGNAFVQWDGCPPAALRKLGVTYAKFDPKNHRLTPNE